MNNRIQNIYSQFDKSLNWNAFLYVFQKLLSASLTFILFRKLSLQDFSIWANVNSVIFLLLLWMDFGFRKSVPRFIPDFSKNKSLHISFTKFIVKWHLVALFFTSLLLLLNFQFIASIIGIKLTRTISYLAVVIFLLEAPIALLRLIYHAHFWNKHFNLLYSSVILFETLANMFILFYVQSFTLTHIFFVKIISCLFTNIFAIIGVINLYAKKEYLEEETPDQKDLKQKFMTHCGYMWCFSSIKSLSERNFLIPVISYSFGLELASVFKIANEWALLFQRGILKTIGTSDTSLFSYVGTKDKKLMNDAFKKIFSKIMFLLIPLLGIFLLLLYKRNFFLGKDQMILQIFLVLLFFYIVETILSPYERFLEVNQRYLILAISYLPFLVFMVVLIKQKNLSLIGLEFFILALSSVKLVGSLILWFYARYKFGLRVSEDKNSDNVSSKNSY